MDTPTAIDRLYAEAKAVLRLLEESSQPSLQNAAGDNFRKGFLLATASYFEHRVCNVVVDFVRQSSNGSILVETFLRNKAIERQYHSWFDWRAQNATQFYGLFGGEFKTQMVEQVKTEEMQKSVRAFLELGNERNKLVHQNYATFSMEKTLEEIYELYKSASKFVDILPEALKTCEQNFRDASSQRQEQGVE